MSQPKTTMVQLTLHARRLKNVAGAFKGTSDPYCVVTLLGSNPQEKPTVLGKTEVIKNSLNPAWTTPFVINYEFGKLTRINVGIYDEVRKAKTNKPMGSAMFEIGDVLGSKGNIKAKVLKHGNGVLYARVESVQPQPKQESPQFKLQLKGIRFKNVDGFFKGKSDPFYEVSRRVSDVGAGHSWQVVYRSKPIMNNLNPTFSPISLDVQRLCDGNYDKPVLISVFDWEKSGRHTPMGFFETTVNGLMRARTDRHEFTLKRKGKAFGKVLAVEASIINTSGGGGIGIGTTTPTISTAMPVHNPALAPPQPSTSAATPPFGLALDMSSPPPQPSYTSSSTTPSTGTNLGYNLPAPAAPPMVRPFPPPGQSYSGASFYSGGRLATSSKPSFVDYVSGGCELQMCIAIDFTGSNGDPRRPGTLHHIHKDGYTLNDYEKALTAVGSIVARYDSDQKFPVYGFGAKYSGILRNCFQVGRSSELSGIGAVLEGYRGVFKTPITMSGPTVFDEVIEVAAAQARSQQEAAQRIGQQAYTILLILTDGAVSDPNATKAAIRAASDAPLSIVIVGIGNANFSAMQFLDDFSKQDGSRDICQFVEFRRHVHDKSSLTQATLDEIPDQLVDYFYNKGIMPLPGLSGSKLSLVPDAYNPDEDIDLTIDFNESGTIQVADTGQGVYDDTTYGNLGTYSDVAVLPPPTAPSAPYNPSAAGHSSYNTSTSSFQNVLTAQQAAHKLSTSHGTSPVVQASVVPPQPSVFYVQLPPGITPGMQIQIQHPSTHQNIIVTVPQGVPPNGTFPVSY